MSRTITERQSDEQGRRGPLRMSEEEFVAWCTRETRAEWVDGEVVFMSPIGRSHDRIQWWVRNVLQFYVEKRGLGEVLGPEFQIRLDRPSRREPDVLYVATGNLGRLHETRLDGPPDLVVEVVSPESESRDWRVKFHEYEAAGVREYWIIDPASQQIEAYSLAADGKYAPLPERDEKIASAVVPGWYLRPAWLWSVPPTDVLNALAELGVR